MYGFLAVAAAKAAMVDPIKKDKRPIAKLLAEVPQGRASTKAAAKKIKVDNSPASSSGKYTIPNFHIQGLDFDGPGGAFPESANVLQERSDAIEAINTCLSSQNAPSTIKTYESLVNQEVGPAQLALDTVLLPLNSEDRFLALFGWIYKNNQEIKWSRVRALKAALTKYHTQHAFTTILSAWTPKMAAMWKGLSRLTSHEVNGKEPIDFPEVIYFLRGSSNNASITMLRNRAIVVVCFFGVRRSAEVRSFTMSDVDSQDPRGIRLKVRCQKNDQEGLGMICIIPDIQVLGINSPKRILLAWIEARGSVAKAPDTSQLLFITTTGNRKTLGNPVSPDSLRKFVTSTFQGNTATHSLRKGGARFYSHAEAPEKATMSQGGWRTTETMRMVYTTLTDQEVQAAIFKAANDGGTEMVLQLMADKFNLAPDQQDAVLAPAAVDYMATVSSAVGNIPWSAIRKHKVGIICKYWTRSDNGVIKSKAISTLTNLRSKFAAFQTSQRPGVTEP